MASGQALLMLLLRPPPRPCSWTARRLAPLFCRSGASFRRPLSSAVAAPRPHETFAIPCRSNGSINIDVFHSSLSSSPIIIYLPPGPVVPDASGDEEQILSALSESSAATIARIQYRASASHPYPTPYHDVLFGYDWVRDYLLRDEFKRPLLARLGICGELMGGSLATMLALTECRVGESRIVAAAVNNPIVDWVFPDELPNINPDELPEPMSPEETALPAEDDMAGSASLHLEEAIQNLKPKRKKKRSTKPPPLTSWQRYGNDSKPSTLELLTERNILFRQPADYLDRFASPIHFFRSPHVQLVQPRPDDLLASKQPEDLLDAEAQFALDHYASFDEKAKTTVAQLPILTRCRAYARNYPPAGTNLSLPAWHITTGTQSPLYDQSEGLAKMLRRSIARQKLKSYTGRSRWHDKSEKLQFEEFAESRVHLETQDGFGLWTSHQNIVQRKAQVQRVGTWLKHSLQPESS